MVVMVNYYDVFHVYLDIQNISNAANYSDAVSSSYLEIGIHQLYVKNKFKILSSDLNIIFILYTIFIFKLCRWDWGYIPNCYGCSVLFYEKSHIQRN